MKYGILLLIKYNKCKFKSNYNNTNRLGKLLSQNPGKFIICMNRNRIMYLFLAKIIFYQSKNYIYHQSSLVHVK